MNIDKIRKNFLSHEATDARVDSVLRLILSLCHPIRVILFGSASRYELTSSSDVDDLKNAKKPLHAKCGELEFPVDFLLVDKETYETKSLIGGALFDARHEGRVLFP